jgi:hypothetical protein
MAFRSFFQWKNTPGRLTRKRLMFILLFYLVWPIGSLFIWLGLMLDDLFFPGYKNQVVDKPLFILGNFRSGSTFLHRLLSRDRENFTSLTTFDIYLVPSVTFKKIIQLVARMDKKIGNPLRRAALALDERTLGTVNIHRISFFQPEEDENILMHIWSTYFVSFLFPFMDELPAYQFFDEAIPEHRRQRIMAFYKSMLQRHLYATGKKHFVAKNPAFSAKVKTLGQFFPDARIIYLVRNPLDMLPSTISWINYARRVFTDPGEGYLYIDEILKMTQYWYRHPLTYLDANPSNRHIILKYDDLIGDPENIIRGFYQQFAYSIPAALKKIVRQSIDETLAQQSLHIYSYEKMGFSREQIVTNYLDIFERFSFDKREYVSPEVGGEVQILPAFE